MTFLAVVETIPSAKDSEILQRAVDEERILITNDKDFGDLIFRSQRLHAGIVLLRLKHDIAATRVATIDNLLRQYGDRLTGAFTVASEDNVRIRPILRLLLAGGQPRAAVGPGGAHRARLAAIAGLKPVRFATVPYSDTRKETPSFET